MKRKLDLNKLKNKVARLKGEKTSSRQSIFWTPRLPKGDTSAEYQVFLVPWPDLEDYPFKERWFYYSLGNMKDADGRSLKDENGRYIKAPLTLKQFGEDDPVENLIRQLWNTEGKEEEEAKQDREDAKNLFAAQTAYIPVIVKGEEELGVRIWKFSSKTVYERLIELFMKPKVGVLNDPENDIWLSINVVEEPKKKFPMNKKIGSIDLELLDRAPLSDDPEKIEKWLNNVPDLDKALESQKYDFEGLKKLLLLWTETADPTEEKMKDAGTEGGKSKKKTRSKKKKEEPKTKEQVMKELEEFEGDDDDEDED